MEYDPNTLGHALYKRYGQRAFMKGAVDKLWQIDQTARFYGDPQMLTLGEHVRIDAGVVICATAPVILGDYTHVAHLCTLHAGWGKDTAGNDLQGSIELADYATLSGGCHVYAVSDDFSGRSFTNSMCPAWGRHPKASSVLLERHAIVGAGSIILPGATLREGAGLAAGSVVPAGTELASWTIYGGVPVARLSARSNEVLGLEARLQDETAASRA